MHLAMYLENWKLLILAATGLFLGVYIFVVKSILDYADGTPGMVLFVCNVVNLVMTISNIVTVSCCIMVFTNRRKLQKQLIESFKAACYQGFFKKSIPLCFLILGILSRGLNAFTFLRAHRWKIYKYYLFQDWQTLLIIVSAHCIYNLLEIVDRKYKYIEHMVLPWTKINSKKVEIGILFMEKSHGSVSKEQHQRNRIRNLTEVTRNHLLLSDVIDDMNIYVGPITFFTFVSLSANTVLSILVMFTFFSEASTDDLIFNVSIHLTCILTMIGQSILLSMIGNTLAKRGQGLNNICHQLMISSDFCKDSEMFEYRLCVLAKQAKTRCCVHKAVGFLNIDLNLLGIISSNIFAFCIVVIQFQLNEK